MSVAKHSKKLCVSITTVSCTARLASKCIHSQEIRVTAERVQNSNIRSKMKRYCFCWKMRQWRVYYILCNCKKNIDLPTSVGTLPGFWVRSAFTASNTSTIPSVLQRSIPLIRAQKIPQRLTVSLKDCKAIHNTYNHASTGQVSIWNSSSYFPWTSTHTNIRPENRYPCTFISYLPCTTTGLFPHLLCTTNSRLVAATMVLGLVQRPSGVQLLSCSCVTLCTWPDWR